jgi:predicted TIM-barrel fold metal-dependent hydrolase
MATLAHRPVDAWMNLQFELPDDPRYRVGYLFSDLAERIARGTAGADLVAIMDEAGIDRAVLTAGFLGRSRLELPALARAVEDHPDRFAASLVVDPRTGMEAVRTVRSAVTDYGIRLIRMLGYETQLPYNHAAYFPVYATCAELGVPVGLNVGLPGPLVPGAAQDPMAVDEVCAFFPELKVVLSHGGEPWPELCVKLLLKWPNLHYMTSAFSPRYIPSAIIDFINTRGADKVMWASDYPVLSVERCLKEIAELPFRDEVRRGKFVRDNAIRLFFPERDDSAGAASGADGGNGNG